MENKHKMTQHLAPIIKLYYPENTIVDKVIYCDETLPTTCRQCSNIQLSKLHLKLPARLAYCAIQCSKLNCNFTVSMSKYIKYRLYSKYKRIQKLLRDVISHQCVLSWSFTCIIELANIDYSWDYRLGALAYKWSLLKETGSWFSTLGGGHSALGDHFKCHAASAQALSLKQFLLARELGDTGLEYRCRLYYALSLTQFGDLKQARILVRRIYRYSRSVMKDEKLSCMCLGVWSRIQHMHRLRRASSKSG